MKLPPADSALGQLMARLPRAGRVEWIGVRPARNVAMRALDAAVATAGAGLAVIAALSGHEAIAAATLRRNVVVSGLPLVALKGRRFRIGDVLLEGTDACDPCSRMEDALGPGGYNAMRGHGGLCARILAGGTIHLGDDIVAIEE